MKATPPSPNASPASSRAGYADGSTPHRSRRVLDWTSLRESPTLTLPAPTPSKEVRHLPNPAPVILTSSRRAEARKPVTIIPGQLEGAPTSPSSPTSCRAKEKADMLQKVMQHTVEDVAKRFFNRSEKLLAEEDPVYVPGMTHSLRTPSETSGVYSNSGEAACVSPGRDTSSSFNTDRCDSLQSSVLDPSASSLTAAAPRQDARSGSQAWPDSPASEQGSSLGRRQAQGRGSVKVAVPVSTPKHQDEDAAARVRSPSVRRWGRCASRSPARCPSEDMEAKQASRSKSLGRPRTASSIRSPSGTLDSPSSSHHKSVSFATSGRRTPLESPTQGPGSHSSQATPKRAGAAKSLQLPKSPTATDSTMRGHRSGSFSRLTDHEPGAGNRKPSARRSATTSDSNPEPASPEGARASSSFNSSRRFRSPSSDCRHRASSPTLQERTSTAMHALEHGMEPPGASDKWRVAQLFSDAVPRSVAKIQRIERVVNPETFTNFLKQTEGSDNATDCGVVFFTPSDTDQLNQICSCGFAKVCGPSARVASDCGAVVQRLTKLQEGAKEQDFDLKSMCVLFCGPSLARSKMGAATDRPRDAVEFSVEDPGQFLVAYTIHFQLCPSAGRQEQSGEEGAGGRHPSVSPERVRSPSRPRKVGTNNHLIQGMLKRLPELGDEVAGTVLLPSNSEEAEAVISLYLQCGGAARLKRPPGVDLREALGGVVVQRIENKMLGMEYLDVDLDPAGGPRYKEDVVWHGTRLKRKDEEASLAHKLQSIAEHGFDPQRCIKGAHAAGGIWVAANPMESFGVGGDGLVAFVICLAKTHYNEWVDTSCARVLQRERVLPLYSLVHV